MTLSRSSIDLPITASSAFEKTLEKNAGPSSYYDFQNLAELKKNSTKTPENLAAVAQQFEGLFMKMIFDSARKANEVFADDNYLNSRETEFYQQMMDAQLSTEITKGSGLGLAAMLVKQLSPYVKTNVQLEIDSLTPTRSFIKSSEKSQAPANLQASSNLQASANLQSSENKVEFSTPEQFVTTLWPHAQKASAQLGIAPEYLLAQAALETGWGKNIIDNSHNLFGIKADANWQGDRVSAITNEVHDGKMFQIKANFRAYEKYEASFNDYVKFIKSQPRYQQAVAVAEHPQAYFQQLQSAGYATDPEYARKVMSIAQQDRLQSRAQAQSAMPSLSLPTLAVRPTLTAR